MAKVKLLFKTKGQGKDQNTALLRCVVCVCVAGVIDK